MSPQVKFFSKYVGIATIIFVVAQAALVVLAINVLVPAHVLTPISISLMILYASWWTLKVKKL